MVWGRGRGLVHARRGRIKQRHQIRAAALWRVGRMRPRQRVWHSPRTGVGSSAAKAEVAAGAVKGGKSMTGAGERAAGGAPPTTTSDHSRAGQGQGRAPAEGVGAASCANGCGAARPRWIQQVRGALTWGLAAAGEQRTVRPCELAPPPRRAASAALTVRCGAPTLRAAAKRCGRWAVRSGGDVAPPRVRRCPAWAAAAHAARLQSA